MLFHRIQLKCHKLLGREMINLLLYLKQYILVILSYTLLIVTKLKVLII